tara:strand:- start:1932 stop:2600 length:669 start_codon:yes stop_codon:yes gene_type:complete
MSKPPSGAKYNFWGFAVGAMNSLMKIGGLSPRGDVTSSWSVTGLDGRHYITMDEDGQRTGWTTINAPGAIQINAGEDITNIPSMVENRSGSFLLANPEEAEYVENDKVEDNAIFFQAQNGDIVIKAGNGKIRMEADSIEMVCNGTKPKGEGHFWLTANNDIEIKATDILVESKSTLKLVSSGVAGLKGKPIEIIGSLITGVSKATNPDVRIGETHEVLGGDY